MMIRGIQDQVKRRVISGVVISADWDPEMEREAIHALVSRSIDRYRVRRDVASVRRMRRWPCRTSPTCLCTGRFASESRSSGDARRGVWGAPGGPVTYCGWATAGSAISTGRSTSMRLPTVCAVTRRKLATYGVRWTMPGDAWRLQVESGYMARVWLLDVRPRPTAIFARQRPDGGRRDVCGSLTRACACRTMWPLWGTTTAGGSPRLSRPSLTTVTLPLVRDGEGVGRQLLLESMDGRGRRRRRSRIRCRRTDRCAESCGAARELREGSGALPPQRRPPIPAPA